MRTTNRSIALTASTALMAGLLGTVAPTASPAAAAPAGASAPVAGIETVGPIPTAGASVGRTWPTLPPGLAQMPRGGVVNPESPYLSVPSLRPSAEVPVRVVEVARGLVMWIGTLSSGWGRVGATLGYAREYRVEAQRASGVWESVGSFSVAPRGAGAGPSVEAGSMSVSAVTGQVSTSWQSPRMAGPVGSAGVGLSWGSNATSPLPGLPGGWQVSAAPGAWALLAESASDVAAARVPGQALAVRAAGAGSVSMEIIFPQASLPLVRGWVAKVRVGSGPWVAVPVSGVRRTAEGVRGTVRVPSAGRVWVRVGARVEETTLWGPPSPVVADASSGSGLDRQARPITGAGARSLVTPGDQPPVVRLTGWDGTQLTFVRNGLGVYEQAGGAVAGYTNRLTWVATNRWEFADSDGGVTVFVNGRAVSFTSKGAALARFQWDGSGRLTSMTNEVGRTLDLRYSGTDECPDWTGAGFAAAPSGLLCQVAYPGGTTTDIGYVDLGISSQIALVKDPGNTGTAFGWDPAGRLVATRSALVSRAATVDPSVTGAVTRLAYGADGRVSRIDEAPGAVGDPVASRTIEYPSIDESELRAWAASPVADNAPRARVLVDAGADYGDLPTTYRIDPVTWRPVASTDARGLTASTGRADSAGDLSSSQDATGRVTTYKRNELGEVTRVAGPVDTGAAGATATTTYDTARTAAGADDPLSGLRALVYSRVDFGGTASPRFLKADASRGALSMVWTGQPAEFSAQAAGVWNPASDAQDAAGSAQGWQFLLTAAAGTDAELVVGGNVCAEDVPCTVVGLPTGPKAVSVQVRRAGTSGWVQVVAAPVGAVLAPLPADDVRPGFGLATVAKSNDDLPGGPTDGSETRYSYANPATGATTGAVEPGGLTSSMAYEASSAGNGSWGRLLTVTTPGGKKQSTTYWGDDADATLPSVCGGATVRVSGQARTVTRADGTTVSTWYDITGRARAQVEAGGGESRTTCTDYFDDGATRSASTFTTAGTLIERVTTDPAVGGNPLVSSVTTEHGAAAPVSPGVSVTTTATVDLLGRAVESTDIGGATTTTVYDILGGVVTRTVTPPSGSGAGPLMTSFEYSPLDGRVSAVMVNSQLAATVSYDGGTGRLVRVAYPNGASVSYAYLPNGALGTVSARTGDAALGTVVETRSQSAYGRITSARVTSSGTAGFRETRGYTFDAAGRLARAVITSAGGDAPTSTSLGYSYAAAQGASCPIGYAGAGKDGMRTGGTINGAPFTVCHDSLGRLASTTSPLVTGGAAATATYDALGRMTALGGDRPLAVTWGADGIPAVIAETGTGGDITTTVDTYAGSIRDKQVVSDAGTTAVRYAGPFRVMLDNIDGSVTGTESVQYALPGNATVTQQAGEQAVLTIPGADGSALVELPVPALGGGGAVTARIADRFGPYGEPLVAPPADTASATPAYTWQAARRAETLPGTSSITLLPARAYHPALGEFLSQDPVIDSANNAYAYTNGDPVNSTDPTGGETEDTTTTVLFSALSAVGGLLALGGGFVNARFAGKVGTGPVSRALLERGPRIGRAKQLLPNFAVVGTAVAAIGSAGAGYAAYAAAKSQNTDEAVSVIAAVGTSLLSAATFYGGAKWGVRSRVQEVNARYGTNYRTLRAALAEEGRQQADAARRARSSISEGTYRAGSESERTASVLSIVTDRNVNLPGPG